VRDQSAAATSLGRDKKAEKIDMREKRGLSTGGRPATHWHDRRGCGYEPKSAQPDLVRQQTGSVLLILRSREYTTRIRVGYFQPSVPAL
jgi:hypothetical protein